jgi:FlaA1/EpsC-like NDP-sugar epimerase
MRDLLVRHTLISGSLQGTARETSGTLIYGAGSAGMMLLQALRNDPQFRIVGFLDDDRRLHGRTLQSLSIHSPEGIQTLIKRHNINQVLLAIPSLERTRKRLLVDQLTHSGLKVSTIPSLAQLATGRRGVTDLQPIAIEDLLGREPSSPDPRLLEAAVRGKAVLVTGAGGSIGSELCRQVLALDPKALVLVDNGEFNLFQIEKQADGQWKVIVKDDGISSTLDIQGQPDFYRQIKDNTGYIIHPDEVLADNFAFIMQEKNGQKVSLKFSPEGKKLLVDLEALLKSK